MRSSTDLWDVTTSELVLRLDAEAASRRYSVFCFNVGTAGKRAIAEFMRQLSQTGKVVSVAQLDDNRIFLMVRHGVRPGETAADLYDERLEPHRVPWADLEDYVALRLLFNSCSQFEGLEDEVPNDTGRLFSVSKAFASKIETVETIVNPDCSVEQKIRTFTKRCVLKARAKGDAKELEKIKSQVGYKLSPMKTLVIAGKNERDEFILRRARGDKPSVRRDMTFSSKAEKFGYTKKGIFYQLLSTVEYRYGDFARLELKQYPRMSFYRVLPSKDYKRAVERSAAGRRVVVSFARNGLAVAARALVDAINAYPWDVCASYGGRHVDGQTWNVVVVPDDISDNDGYVQHSGVIEQHVSASIVQLATTEKSVLGSIFKELLVKQDIVDGHTEAFDLHDFGVDELETCGLAVVPCKQDGKVEMQKLIATLRIGASGALKYSCRNIEDGPETDLELDLLDAEGELDMGAYTFAVDTGDKRMIARVRDTGLVTFPNDFVSFVRDRQLKGEAGRGIPIFETYYSPFYGIGSFERNGRTCYFVGVDNGTNEAMRTAVHVREIEVIEGDDLSDLLVRLTNVGLSRFGRPSMWPISVKYLNEAARRYPNLGAVAKLG